ncbi:MAG: hypothetical protein ACREOF_15635 [Gemmatimonadales bacterium]
MPAFRTLNASVRTDVLGGRLGARPPSGVTLTAQVQPASVAAAAARLGGRGRVVATGDRPPGDTCA